MLWIKLEEKFFEHPKLVLAADFLDVNAPRDQLAGPVTRHETYDYRHLIVIGCHATLLMWALRFQPDGDISKIDPDVLEKLIGWPGAPGKLMQALMYAGFVDYQADESDPDDPKRWRPLQIHGFVEYYEELNRERIAHNRRQQRYREKKQRVGDVYITSSDGHVTSGDSQVTPREEEEEEEGSKEIHTSNAPDANASHDDVPSSPSLPKVNGKQFAGEVEGIRAVCAHYLTHYPQREKQTKSEKVRSKIRARLREGFTSEQLCQAVDGMAASQFHTENGHTSLELAVRDASHVDQFITKKAQGSGYRPTAWARLMNDKQ